MTQVAFILMTITIRQMNSENHIATLSISLIAGVFTERRPM